MQIQQQTHTHNRTQLNSAQTICAKGSGSESQKTVNISGREWRVVEFGPQVRVCPICMDALGEKTVCNQIDHTVCSECEPRILLTSKCPDCRKTTSPAQIRDVLSDNISRNINTTKMGCTACSWEGLYPGIKAHIAHCGEVTQSCPYSEFGCNKERYGADLQMHQSVCPYRPVACSYECGESVATIQLKAHQENQCRKRPVKEGVLETSFEELQSIKKLNADTSNDPDALLARSPQEKDQLLRDLIKYFPVVFTAATSPQAAATAVTQQESLKCLWECGSWFATAEQMGRHQNECPLALIHCEFCREDLQRRSMVAHLELCPEKTVECPYECGGLYKRDRLGSHFDQCPNVEVKCNYCDIGVPRGEIISHQKTACEKNEVKCSMCLTSAPFYQIHGAHKQTCPLQETMTVGSLNLKQLEGVTGPAYNRHGRVVFIIPSELVRERVSKPLSEVEIQASGEIFLQIKNFTRLEKNEGVALLPSAETLSQIWSYKRGDTYNGCLRSFNTGKVLMNLRNGLDHQPDICSTGTTSMKSPVALGSAFKHFRNYREPFFIVEFSKKT